ncbi:polysaccharide export protein [Diplodia corticola]|uniref:Polysaccharide export protein n=1 Tax=Diplodia corticola TaxID=236234 RepID=A0A1J9QRD4_9PEZI|nr:polysaccharide export protein [Diplodia corticola]OJD30977.1 polysaccharide export protein [Diplodia corticola]
MRIRADPCIPFASRAAAIVEAALESPRRVTTDSLPLSSHERIFIASIHWNNEAILRSHWNAALIDLVQHLGPSNVFVSILESGSWDGSKAALRELDAKLEAMQVPRSIILDPTTHKDELEREPKPGSSKPGWIWTPRGRQELRRIPYLANLRNRVMEAMHTTDDAKPFTKVLWLNDVVFTTTDVLTLLSTNNGHYAAACSLDFSHPPRFYDTFALRDAGGHKPLTPTWPYFLSAGSRGGVVAGRAGVPVKSCWNGMVVMDAGPFYSTTTTTTITTTTTAATAVTSSDGEGGDDGDGAPLRFRGIPDALASRHLEGSECCLIHADNPLTPGRGVWLNPHVRVGYGREAYEAVNPGGGEAMWPGMGARVRGVWRSRVWGVWGRVRGSGEGWVVRRRVEGWGGGEAGVGVGGEHCLVNEMQVVVENGWRHL